MRAPNVLFTVVAMYLLYKGVAKVFGRRAGLLGAIVLATMPDWYFLAHQTMTDMPCVARDDGGDGAPAARRSTPANRAGARLRGEGREDGVAALGVAPRLRRRPRGRAAADPLPALAEPRARAPRERRARPAPALDEFYSGSRGNCGLPGNEACTLAEPRELPKSIGPHPDAFGPSCCLFGGFEPVVQGLLWSLVLGFVLYLNWGERRLRRLFYLAAWFFGSVATMAKGRRGS